MESLQPIGNLVYFLPNHEVPYIELIWVANSTCVFEMNVDARLRSIFTDSDWLGFHQTVQ